MAILDFPNNPTVGQIYNGTNGVTYTWDGTVWTVPLGGAQLWSVSGSTLTPTDATKGLVIPGTSLHYQLVLGNRTQKTRFGGFQDIDYAGFSLNVNYTGALVADDTSKATWLCALRNDQDRFTVERGPAGNPMGSTALLTLDNAGNLAVPGNLKVQTPAGGNTGRLQFEWSGSNGFIFANHAYAPIDSTLASWTLQIDCTSAGWFQLYRRAANAAVGPGTQTAYVKDNGDFGIIGANAYKASGTTWSNPSDPRLKDDVAPYAAGLAEVCQLAPISYRLKAQPDGPLCYGFDASAVRDVFPECVSTTRMKLDPADEEETDDVLVFDMHPILVAVVNALKTVDARLAALEAR